MTEQQPVRIPRFFMALVLHDKNMEENPPSADDCDLLRQRTIDFWTDTLQKAYPQTFQQLELTLGHQLFGTALEDVPEDVVDLEDTENGAFNAYFEFEGQATFSSKRPDGDQIFYEMVKGDSLEYLKAFVRDGTGGTPFEASIHVFAKRLEKGPAFKGGNVRSPAFFIAFATDDPHNEERDLTEGEVQEYYDETLPRIRNLLKEEYPDTFQDCTLKVDKAEAGHEKPDDRFSLYLENEVVATFSHNPPDAGELFNTIMKCVSRDSTDYLVSFHTRDVPPYDTVTTVTIQLVGLEIPDIQDPTEKPEEEQQQQPEDGDGDDEPDDEEEEEEELPDDIDVQVPVFLALVVDAEPPAKLPDRQELEDFTKLMESFLYTEVKRTYPDGLVNFKMKEKETQFDAGIPETRFNMCVDYDASIRFRAGTDPLPTKKSLKMVIVQCNYSSILANVKKMEPICFQKATEVTMRKKSKKKKHDPSLEDVTFEAAVDPPPPQPKPALQEKRAPKNQSPPSKKDAATPQTKDKTSTTAPPKKKNPPKKKQSKERNPTDKAPTSPRRHKSSDKPPESPTPSSPRHSTPFPMSPSSRNLQRVRTSDIYVALMVDQIDSMPGDKDLAALTQGTKEYMGKVLKQSFPDQFVKLDLGIRNHEWQSNKPNKHYNTYIEFDINAGFKSSKKNTKIVQIGEMGRRVENALALDSSDDDDDDDGVPGPQELTRALVKNADIMDYLVNHVRSQTATDFANATAVHFHQTNSIKGLK